MIKIDFTQPNIKLKETFKHMHPSDIAVIFIDNPETRDKIIELLSIKVFSKAFLYLSDDLQVKYFLKLSKENKTELLKYYQVDDLKDFIELFRVSYHDEIINLLSKDKQEKIKKALAYEGGSAGSILATNYLVFDINESVKDVTSKVIKESNEHDEIDVVFFKDDIKFLGGLKLQDLIIARENEKFIDLVDLQYPYAYDDDLASSAIRKIRNYDVTVLPVLNDKKHLVGIITSEDALDIMQDDHMEALENLVALDENVESSNPLKRSIQRLPWLLMSVVMNIVIASFLTTFSGTIDSQVALVLFQPMILGMAGNIGTQSIAVTILGLHQDKIKPARHIKKEISIAVINSLISGVIGVGIVFLFLWVMPTDFEHIDKIALVVGLSLIFSMFVSALVGVLIPFGLRKLGADEKAASGPIISTVNDFCALGIYFLIATILFNFF